jgi:V/A-type H+-transporting ATPase subunit B
MTPAERPPLVRLELETVAAARSGLLFVERAPEAAAGELVEIEDEGERRLGVVLEVDARRAVVQVLGGGRGLKLAGTRVRLTGEPLRLGVGEDLLGRVLDGMGRVLDGSPPPRADAFEDISGRPINPAARESPHLPIETGVSVLDVLLTLARGQKLPVFTGYGLPGDALATRIAVHVAGGASDLAVVFGAIGATRRTAEKFQNALDEAGALERTVLVLDLADRPSLERLMAPRVALTVAEHLAFSRGWHVLVVLTDMTAYAEALREVAAARDELPARRGYPGAMYSDLASIYERAGCLRGRPGSVTQLPVVSMPSDDLSHPVPDLTGYITEGQIVLSRELHARGLDPPVDVLPSLSRLMGAAIGTGKTRPSHGAVADRLYARYALARDLRRQAAILGEDAIRAEDREQLAFADRFERTLIHQEAPRSFQESLDLAESLAREN